MKIYLDSEDCFYSINHEPEPKQEVKPKKEIITTKLIIIMAAVAICKIAILLTL